MALFILNRAKTPARALEVEIRIIAATTDQNCIMKGCRKLAAAQLDFCGVLDIEVVEVE
jgi:hypothetical protein